MLTYHRRGMEQLSITYYIFEIEYKNSGTANPLPRNTSADGVSSDYKFETRFANSKNKYQTSGPNTPLQVHILCGR
jgi:hypothetical protein